MEIIRFAPIPPPYDTPSGTVDYNDGKIVNGITEVTWIERHYTNGEFTLVAPVGSGVKEELPVGTMISHTNSYEIMLVENQEIVNGEEGAEIIISGRTFETWLENRTVGSNELGPTRGMSRARNEPGLNPTRLSEQICRFINKYTTTALPDSAEASDNIAALTVFNEVSINAVDPIETRILRRTDVYTQFLELMKLGDFGYRLHRPSMHGSYWFNSDLAMIIHDGNNLADTVTFSFDTGSLKSAEYLWSNKGFKTAAHVITTWREKLLYTSGYTGFNRRYLLVDASDLDSHLTSAPTGSTLTQLELDMSQRGREALKSAKLLSIIKAELNQENRTIKYRWDYNMGDIVSIVGDYGTVEQKRIIEYVEIRDEQGSHGYPTFGDV